MKQASTVVRKRGGSSTTKTLILPLNTRTQAMNFPTRGRDIGIFEDFVQTPNLEKNASRTPETPDQ